LRGVVVELNNEPVRWHFTGVLSDQVTYKEIVHHYSAGAAPSPSPFIKEMHFAPQSEARVVLFPKQEPATEWLTIRLAHPEKMFVEEFRTVPNMG